MRLSHVLCFLVALCVISALDHGSGRLGGTAAGQSLYDTLGVGATASMTEISKAFRRLAVQYHPDKNPGNAAWAQEQFIRISQAFELLSDPHSRKIYDESGSTTGQEASGGVRQNPGQQRSPLMMELLDLYRGIQTTLTVSTQCLCSQCGGTKVSGAMRSLGGGGSSGSDGSHDVEAPGSVTHRHEGGPCPKCQGSGIEDCSLSFRADIVKGCNEGSTLVVPNRKLRTVVKQLIVVVYSKPHPDFRRVDSDLYTTLGISQMEADIGFKKTLKTIDGRDIIVLSHDPVTEGHVIKIRHEGMPVMGSKDLKGRLYVSLHIEDAAQELRSAFGEYFEDDEEDVRNDGSLWPYIGRCYFRLLSVAAAAEFCAALGVPFGKECTALTSFFHCEPFNEAELAFLVEMQQAL